MKRLEAGTLAALPGIAHGFFGREGGVSSGLYDSLNCGPGSKDEPAAVTENRRRVATALAPEARLVSLAQIHSPFVHIVGPDWDTGKHPEGDGLATATPGLGLSILTADCGPVLFADAQAGVIGAAHAGWKGAISGVTDQTITAMEALGARRERIIAAIGPCIGRASYEVDLAFVDRFETQDPDNGRFFSAGREGHAQFDIAAYVAARLADAGMARVEMLDEDTYSQPDRFYSYRRTCHRGEPDYGRQISMIAVR